MTNESRLLVSLTSILSQNEWNPAFDNIPWIIDYWSMYVSAIDRADTNFAVWHPDLINSRMASQHLLACCMYNIKLKYRTSRAVTSSPEGISHALLHYALYISASSVLRNVAIHSYWRRSVLRAVPGVVCQIRERAIYALPETRDIIIAHMSISVKAWYVNVFRAQLIGECPRLFRLVIVTLPLKYYIINDDTSKWLAQCWQSIIIGQNTRWRPYFT